MSGPILVLGNGYIGRRLANYLDAVVSSSNLFSLQEIREEINRYNPDVVINCCGKTGKPNIDWCESHKEDTMFSNVTLPLMIHRVCSETGKYLVHIGSGCVYNGVGGEVFSETDPPNFSGSFYSKTKLISEAMLSSFDVLQLRIRMPTDYIPHSRNLINKLVNYKCVIDVLNSITYIPDFLEAAGRLIGQRKTGIYNVVTKTPVTHPFILNRYRESVDEKFDFTIMTLEDLQAITVAPRSNCVLSTKKLEVEGIKVRDGREAIKDCMEKWSGVV